MNGFGQYTPYGSEDIEAYLRRFTSFLFTKGVTKPATLAAGASTQEQAAYAVLLTAYNDSRKSWLLASMGLDCYAILRKFVWCSDSRELHSSGFRKYA